MKEILAGEGFENAVYALQLDCKRTYCGDKYEVWEIGDNDLEKIICYPEEIWKPEWGWCRCADGCNITHWPTSTFMVNDAHMIGFYNELDKYARYKIDRRYVSLTEYLCDVIGASTPKNVCALAVDIAKLNSMTMAELFATYEG